MAHSAEWVKLVDACNTKYLDKPPRGSFTWRDVIKAKRVGMQLARRIVAQLVKEGKVEIVMVKPMGVKTPTNYAVPVCASKKSRK